MQLAGYNKASKLVAFSRKYNVLTQAGGEAER